MKENGRDLSEMVMAFRNGQMEQSTKVSGEIIGPMAKGDLGMLMAIFLKGNGKMIRRMAMESINMQLELLMKVNGRMICKKGMALKFGKTVLNTKDFIRKGKNTEKVRFHSNKYKSRQICLE